MFYESWTEVSPFGLRHEVQNSGDQWISSGVAGNLAIDTKTLAAEVLGEGASQIGEGVLGTLGRGVASRRGLVQMGTVDPGDGRRCHAEIQMIGHGIRVARLRLRTTDLLFDFAKSGLDFPARPIIFDNLRDREGRIGSH